MTGGLAGAIASHLTPEILEETGDSLADIDAGSVLDPDATAGLPPEVLDAVRQALADQLHIVFLASLPILAVAFLATLAIKAIPLADTVHTPEDARLELLDTLAQSSVSEEVVPGLGHREEGARTRERVLALHLELLLRESGRTNRVLLRRAVTDIGNGDLAAGQAILDHTARMLTSDDRKRVVEAEKFAAALDRAANRPGGVLSDEVRKEIAVRVAADKAREEVLSSFEPAVADDYEAIDFGRLRHATNDLSTVLLLDLDRPWVIEPQLDPDAR